jgi:hypothetical protein
VLSLVNSPSPALKHVHICPALTHHNGSLQPFLLSVSHLYCTICYHDLILCFLRISRDTHPAYNAIVVVTLSSV